MRLFFLAILLFLLPAQARAAELIMFDGHGCYHCLEWKSKVGRYYHKTREGIAAPLTIVNIQDPRPARLSLIQGVRATPTFVLIDQGREIGRIVGFPGEKRFWLWLAEFFPKH